ncbi:hypothetical protein OS493_037108 [Desmophyllum pertusum]|uniref:Potassium channel domain-containing protein n=1 Tax=Desmophyllum pertusum TaxID=174260 RepID=A0A9X0CHU0_9CNID|nr:hypothetical protein OS493_037108 [Desmophyllum pertusum]
MSGFKAFLYLFIALNFYVMTDCRRSQNQSGCVQVHKNAKFPFEFLHNINQSEWENAVHKIKNYTNDCLSSEEGRNCQKPFITITFPVISGNPRIPLQVLPRTFPSHEGRILPAPHTRITKQTRDIFLSRFWSGIREGLWWAIVTMTTVGYGDKTPKSCLGRVYASLWMIIGMLLMSTITAQISSTITTDGLRPLDEEFGHKIGVPNGSAGFFETESRGAILKEYSTESDLFQSLQDGTVDKIWLFDCKENGIKQDFMIVNRLDVTRGKAPVVGVEIKLPEYKNRLKKVLDQCLRKWARNETADEAEESFLKQVASRILGDEADWDAQEPERYCIENHKHSKYHDSKWSSPQLGLIDILLCIAAGLLITLLTTGTLWNIGLKMRHARILDNKVDIEKGAGIGQELQSVQRPF